MAVQNKPARPVQRPTPRPAQNPAAAPQRPSIQKAVAQAQPAGVHRGTLRGARDVYAHKTPAVHTPNAHYSVDPRPQSPLKAITKDAPNASSGGLIPHGSAVAFLDSFLSRGGKNRGKV